MRAYQLTDFDTPAKVADIPVPAPKQGEMRIRIMACGLNFADLLMIKGKYQDTPPPPLHPGNGGCRRCRRPGP